MVEQNIGICIYVVIDDKRNTTEVRGTRYNCPGRVKGHHLGLWSRDSFKPHLERRPGCDCDDPDSGNQGKSQYLIINDCYWLFMVTTADPSIRHTHREILWTSDPIRYQDSTQDPPSQQCPMGDRISDAGPSYWIANRKSLPSLTCSAGHYALYQLHWWAFRPDHNAMWRWTCN